WPAVRLGRSGRSSGEGGTGRRFALGRAGPSSADGARPPAFLAADGGDNPCLPGASPCASRGTARAAEGPARQISRAESGTVLDAETMPTTATCPERTMPLHEISKPVSGHVIIDGT